MARSTTTASCPPACRSRPPAIASRRCICGAARGRPMRTSCAACTPSRSIDRAARSLTLTRDRFGIKPLYTATIPGGLAFASEPQALLAAGLVQRAVRPAARDELLQMQFTTGADTIFPGIQRVLPGETLRVVDGHVVDRSVVEALPAGPPEEIDEAARWPGWTRRWSRSVDLHQRSDVPYGMFLSGGVDSAAILALMARLNASRCWPSRPGSTCRARPTSVPRPPTGPRGRGAARDDRGDGGDGVGHAAADRRLHGRPGRRLRHHPDLVPGPAGPAGREGGAVRRGRRRDLRRLWPLPQRDAAVVARRPGDAGARHVRQARHVARDRRRLARRHRRGGGAARQPGGRTGCRWRRRPTWRIGCRTTCC